MNKTLLIRQTEVNAEKYVKELYEADITVSINRETLKVTVKPKNKGSVKKEIKEFIINYCNEELASLKTKSVDDSVVMANNNNNNDIVSAIKEVIEVTKPEKKKKWDDILEDELNRGHLIEFKETTIPVKQISGKNYEWYGVVYTSLRSGIKYSWNYYGDVQYMTIEDLSEMLDREKDYIKKELKPLDNKILKLYDLEKYYEFIEYVNGIEIKELISKSPDAQRQLINRVKELSEDTYTDLRSRVCHYFITADDMTLGQLRNILPIYKLTEYDIRITNNEVRGNIRVID